MVFLFLIIRFKPYKGVSSNVCPPIEVVEREGFKPYKGVSSNAVKAPTSNKPRCFKPYKGVSSNRKKTESQKIRL